METFSQSEFRAGWTVRLLLVAIRACDVVGKSRRDICGLTMPGFNVTPAKVLIS